MNANIEKIAAAFITDMANKYSMPELLTARRVPNEESTPIANRYGKDGMFAIADVHPTGQLSAIVRTLNVAIVVTRDELVEHLYYGNIKFSYDHCSGGSNGNSTDFIIAVETRFGQDEIYVGALEKNAFTAVKSHLYYYEKDQKKSNDS